jgi:hypothetical protein
MGIHTKSIEKVVTTALRNTPADQIDLYGLIKMSPEEVEERAAKNAAFGEAISEARAAIAFARNANNSTLQMIERARRDIDEAGEQATEKRREYVAAVREIKLREGRLEQLVKTQEIFSAENVQALIREFRFVKNNPAIESVEIVQEGIPEMVVRPKPLVIDYRDTSYWLNNLGFAIDLTDLSVQWLAFRSGSGHNVHPHISTGGQICWGDAAVLVQEARERRDIAGLVKIITDWMTLYNDRSPYVRIEQFPTSTEEVSSGWQV